MFELDKLLKKHSVVGIVGNRSTAKTSMVLDQLISLRNKYKKIKIAVMGVNRELNPVLNKYNITIINSKMDILDLQMRDTIIFIDEMAMFFDTKSRNKQLEKLQRFFDRIEHQNCKMLVGTAREGYFNKFMCSRVTAFLVKQIEYDALVNGTWLNERVKAITSLSDYRLVADKSEFYLITAGDGQITSKHTFEYNAEIDTKKENINLFEKDEKISEKKDEKKREKKESEKMKRKVNKKEKKKDDFYCERHQLEFDDYCKFCKEEEEIDMIYDREVGK